MPIKAQRDLPAKATLGEGNISTVDEDRATSQDIRPLEILILNLVPPKEGIETQLMRALSDTPFQADCTFPMLSTHVSKSTSTSHLNRFYAISDEIKKKKYDGMIVTGASAENLKYEEVNYWPELSMTMEWNKTYVTFTICTYWEARVELYYHYGIPEYPMKKKLSGIYNHRTLDRKVPLVRSLNDFFLAPYSKYTEAREADILEHPELAIPAESDEAGVFLMMNRDGRQVSVQNHPEHNRMALNGGYRRDLNKGLDPEVPYNYYEDNDPLSAPPLIWRNTFNMLYTNWLNYYVYQMISYLLDVEE